MENFNFQSTFFSAITLEEEKSTTKKVSSISLPGENTDITISPSILNLPQELFEKSERQSKKKITHNLAKE